MNVEETTVQDKSQYAAVPLTYFAWI